MRRQEARLDLGPYLKLLIKAKTYMELPSGSLSNFSATDYEREPSRDVAI